MKESQIRVLEYLSRFKYLSVEQMFKLGVLNNKSGIYQILKPLKEGKRNLIDLKNFGVAPVYGKLDAFYFLTKYGVQFLNSELFYDEDIKFPIGKSTLFSRDYFHRKFTIDFHINLYMFLNANSEKLYFVDYYFDKLGSNRTNKNLRAKNHIEIAKMGAYIIPDIVFKFNIDNRDYLYLFEQHNGKDTKRLIRQLESYLLVLQSGVASIKYKFDRSVRVVVVFEHISIKNALLERLSVTKEFQAFVNFFIFKTNDEVADNFFDGWSKIDGDKTSFIS